MSRLSREKKREQKRAARSAPAASPFEVRVPVDGPGAGGASIGGVPVAVTAGEEVQQAVLSHLHRIAAATGHPVHATIHDDRIGYVVPLQIDPDGSSHFSAEPWAVGDGAVPPVPGTPEHPAAPAPAGFPPPPPLPPAAVVEPERQPEPEAEAEAEREPEDRRPSPDPATHLLRSVAEPQSTGESAQTFPLRAVPESEGEVVPTFPLRAVPESAGESVPTFPLHAVPESAQGGTPLGSVRPPTGEFGPPPTMDAPPPATDVPETAPAPDPAAYGLDPARPRPEPAAPLHPEPAPAPRAARTPGHALPPVPEPGRAARPAPDPAAYGLDPARPRPEPAAPLHPEPAPAPRAAPTPGHALLPVPASGRAPRPAPIPIPIPDLALTTPEPDPKPTPARGFDAVAEAVLGDGPTGSAGDGATPAFLAEPMARINEAVKAGRIEEAAGLAERTVDEAAGGLGPEHPEVLRLRELTAYIAYLAGDPVRSLHLSLDLARIRHRTRDTEAAYGNVQSAATAWRAVRDPEQGLALGRDLIDLWTELTTDDGPAADEIEQLESARARMGRLTERARKATG
nr:tetratricopeptide repeat protein [Streptomyces sp. NBC_00886]